MPKPPEKPARTGVGKPPKPVLLVHSSLWPLGRWYEDRDGRQIEIASYDQARAYAAANGYSGIRVTFT